MMVKTKPALISGFTDLIIHHILSGEGIYLVNGKLVAGFDLLVDIKKKYNFLDTDTKAEIETAIQENKYMFEIIESNRFYYPNDNMFGGDNSQRDILGEILFVKKKYI